MNIQTVSTTDVRVERHAKQLSRQLKLLRERLFPPLSQKTLRPLTSGEAAYVVCVSDGYLRQLSIDGKAARRKVSLNGRRSYTLAQENERRHHMASIKPMDVITYLPRRRPGEKLQTIAVTNFKDRSANHHHIIPRAISCAGRLSGAGGRSRSTSLADVHAGGAAGVRRCDGETLYGAIRYDEKRRPLKEIIRKTCFDGLDLVPGNLELMEYEHETLRALNERSRNGEVFLKRVGAAIAEVEQEYNLVVIDCPQLG